MRVYSDFSKVKLGDQRMTAPQTPKSHMDLLVFRLGIVAKSLSEVSISIIAPNPVPNLRTNPIALSFSC